ncbi:MAG: heavy-metal-associated domain-containing protein, partial [Desulfamplus sp.]|nr:heavy-metal-associated domain-containing protein [Desulfamplus sp.]
MNLQEISLNVEGMNCSHCSGAVKKAIESINGLSDIKVDLKDKKAFFKTSDNSNVDKVKEAIIKAG